MIATIIPASAAAAAIAVAAYASNGVIFVSAVCVAVAGNYSAIPQFWRLPALRLSGSAAAAGIAQILAASNASGFVAPYVTGYAADVTGNFRDALLIIAVIMLIGVVTISFTGRRSFSARPASPLAPAEPARRAAAGGS